MLYVCLKAGFSYDVNRISRDTCENRGNAAILSEEMSQFPRKLNPERLNWETDTQTHSRKANVFLLSFLSSLILVWQHFYMFLCSRQAVRNCLFEATKRKRKTFHPEKNVSAPRSSDTAPRCEGTAEAADGGRQRVSRLPGWMTSQLPGPPQSHSSPGCWGRDFP